MKTRLYGKNPPRLPKPVSAKRDTREGFSLRIIDEADHRFAVVKQMKSRVDRLIEETGSDTLAKQFMAGRAVFILSYLESTEIDALEGKQIDWKAYLAATKALTDALHKLGMNREAKSAITLSDYVADKVKKKGKPKKPK
jgi:hypothetical protein